MLPGETDLPETIVAPDGQIVNALFERLSHDSDQRLALMLRDRLCALQIRWFSAQDQRAVCPSCSSTSLVRKGWRQRIVATSRGRFRLLVLQVRCRSCGRTFRPWNDRLGLPASRRCLTELETKAVLLGTQVSFSRSAKLLRQLTGGTMSSEGVRRKIAARAQSLQLPKPQPGQTVLVDATKVKAGKKERGAPVYLAITAQPGRPLHGRPTCHKQLVHLHVGTVGPLKRKLRMAKPDYLVHDGGDALTDCARSVQRCRWHLGHQLKHYLWQDGVPHGFRSSFQEALMEIMNDSKQGPKRYAKWAENLMACGLTTAAGHLQLAASNAFTFLKEPGFAYIDTSPLEREMRELNRRADIGARWSPIGVENVLKVLFHQRLNESTKGHT